MNRNFTVVGAILMFLFFISAASLHAQLSGFHLQNFESEQFPPAGWIAESVMGEEQWERTTDENYDGQASAYMSYDYPEGEDWLISPQFSVATDDSLIFYLALDYSGYAPDSLVIRLSSTDYSLSSFTEMLLKLEEGVNYPSDSGVWQRYAVSLTPFAGEDVYIAFSHYNQDGDGIYLDQILIGQLPETDAMVNAITSPVTTVQGASYIPAALVTNQSQTAQDISFTMEIEGGYSSTVSSGELQSLQVAAVEFDPFVPETAGMLEGVIYAQLPGDENTSNDTLYFTLEVNPIFPNFGWSAQTALPGAAWGSASAFLKKCGTVTDTGYVYSIAGINGSGTTVSDVFRYNTMTQTWSAVASLPEAKQQIGAAAVQNKIFVPGGYTLSFSPVANGHVYDPATDEWTAIADMPFATGDYAIGTYADSLIYVVGGYNGSSDITAVQIYNVNTDTWASGTEFPGIPTAGLRMGIVDGKIVLVGGYNQVDGQQNQAWLGEIDDNDPQSIIWTQLSDFPGGTTGRLAAGVSTLNDGRVYFTSGDPDGNGSAALAVTYAYNVNTGQWEGGPDKITGVSNVHSFTPYVQNDSLYLGVLGGYDGGSFVSAFESLNLGHYIGDANPISASETVICAGSSVSLSAMSNFDFTWSPDSLFDDVAEENPVLFPEESVTVKLTRYPHFGCAVMDSLNIVVNPLPEVSLSLFENICADSPAITLTEGTPAGGEYSGPGVDGDTFDPVAAGIGTHLITYTFTDENGCAASAEAAVNVSDCVGIDDAAVSAGIKVYPNPAVDVVNISANLPIERIEIYQMDGKQVSVNQVEATAAVVNVSNLSSGIYLVRVHVQGEVFPYQISKR